MYANKGEYQGKSRSEWVRMTLRFLQTQFFRKGTCVPSQVALRDLALRCTFGATMYTGYGLIEKAFVSGWQL